LISGENHESRQKAGIAEPGNGFWIALGVFPHSHAEADSNLKWSRKIVRHGLIDQPLCSTNAASQAELFMQYGD